jgi:hypothetical protein
METAQVVSIFMSFPTVLLKSEAAVFIRRSVLVSMALLQLDFMLFGANKAIFLI